MEYNTLVKDFATRTMRNLELIEERAQARDPQSEAYEVTQLVNSMLGLLVFPQQKYFNNIKPIPLDELKADGWPIPDMKGCPPHAQDLRGLMRCLRNGISHFNLQFTCNGTTITGLRVWNCKTDECGKYVKDDRNHRIKEWEAELTVGQLREISRRFVKLLLDVES